MSRTNPTGPADAAASRRSTRTRLAVGGVLALVGVSCSGDARETSEAVIERQISEQVDLGELEATCDEPERRQVGDTFPCTATTESGEVIQIVTTFEEDDRIFVLPTNVVLAADLALVEQKAAEVLSPEVGVTIDPADVECPDRSVVLGGDGRFFCEITDPESGTTFELIATFGDFVRDEGFRSRFYEIGDPTN